MKLRTHVVAGFSIAFSLGVVMGLGIAPSFVGGVLAAFVNYVIDRFGHKGFRRSPFTHSLFGVAMICLAIFIAISLLIQFLHLYVDPIKFVLFCISVFAGATFHLLLDAFTESGIYLKYPFSKKRFAVTRLRYDNPILNALVVLASLALVISVLMYCAGLMP